jgi:hypothetical protein
MDMVWRRQSGDWPTRFMIWLFVLFPGLSWADRESNHHSLGSVRPALETHGAPLHVLSLVALATTRPALDGALLPLRWPRLSSKNSNVHLSAVSLRYRSYYRMDSSRDAKANRFNWSTSQVRALNLDLDDFGYLAVASEQLSKGRTDDVFIPLIIGDGKPQTKGTCYEMVLISDIALLRISWSLTPIEQDGFPGVPEVAKQVVKGNNWAPARPIRVPLPCTKHAGRYQIEIDTIPWNDVASNDTTPTQFIFDAAR